MLRALLAVVLLLPLAAIAGSVPVCDGTVSQVGPDGSGLYQVVCSVAWRVVDEPSSSWLLTLSLEDAGTVAVSVLLLWSCAAIFRMVLRVLDEQAP